jgi:hypothetical protein
MTTDRAKPRLVFFQYRYDENLPEFLLIHKRDHVNCLSHFFDVTVIDHDCDYQQICDTYEPDLALFESGVNHTTCKRLDISNIRSSPGVPRVALHNADAFCNARSGFLSDMDHWGIETFFTITVTAAEHMPGIADRIFAWPNAIDPALYRDYGGWKSIPVLFSGNTSSLYPWRHKIIRLVAERYPSLMCPHPGYEPTRAAAQVLFGEPYARMLNASAIVPACGTVARDIVRKHFEVPGSNACLLTERSAPLEAAGFADMENCVFADESDVLDKLEHLFRNPDELQRITRRGHDLVHSRHTQKHRDQIYQWYRLNRDLEPNQRIIQADPFGQLAVVDRHSSRHSGHVAGHGLHLRLLHDGDAQRSRNFAAAEAAYLKCSAYMRWMPEPKFGVALCRLQMGDAATANAWLSQQIEFVLGGYGAVDPDPVEWAYYTLSLLCLGKSAQAAAAAREFPWLRHPDLDRMRRTIAHLTGTPAGLSVSDAPTRHTVHQIPPETWAEWLTRIEGILRACEQSHLAERLITLRTAHVDERAALNVSAQVPVAHGRRTRKRFERRFRRQNTRWGLKRHASRLLHTLESRFGYFLPYRLSAMKRDEYFGALRRLVTEQHVTRVLVLGGMDAGSAEALLAAIAETSGKADVLCIGEPTSGFRRFEAAFAGRIECLHLRSSAPEDGPREIDRALQEIRGARNIDAWDAVIVNGSVLGKQRTIGRQLEMLLHHARLAVFEGLAHVAVSRECERLMDDPDYLLVANDPGLRAGYAIFRRKSPSCTPHGVARAVSPRGDFDHAGGSLCAPVSGYVSGAGIT